MPSVQTFQPSKTTELHFLVAAFCIHLFSPWMDPTELQFSNLVCTLLDSLYSTHCSHQHKISFASVCRWGRNCPKQAGRGLSIFSSGAFFIAAFLSATAQGRAEAVAAKLPKKLRMENLYSAEKHLKSSPGLCCHHIWATLKHAIYLMASEQIFWWWIYGVGRVQRSYSMN